MIRYLSRRRQRDERGAIAVMFALLALVLFGVGALAVDLGNMYQRKAEAQSQADLAALSSATALAGSNVTAAHAAAVSQVAKYLKANVKLGQNGTYAAPTAAMLTDGDLKNGEVTFYPLEPYKMTVTTPEATVNFALAGAVGKSSSRVAASATVGVGTPGATRVMPFYAVTGSGCDYGTQALSDPANGQVQSIVPTLWQPSDLTPPASTKADNGAKPDGVSPYQVDQDATATLNITGQGLNQVTQIGFFHAVADGVPKGFMVPVSTVAAHTANTVGVTIDSANVSHYPGIWWIRVYSINASNGNVVGWSSQSLALPLRIGDGPIQCGSVSNSGNFGTLKLARSTATSTWAPDNMAVGLQSPLSLAVQTDPLSLPTCSPGGSSVIYTATTGGATRYANTNCVDTDTGLTALVTTQGLVTGTGSGYAGRLVGSTTTAVAGRQCGVGHSNSQRNMLGYSLNDDTLTCFMQDASMPLSTIASSTYSGGAVLDPAIYDSPRFCYVPVLAVDPSSGGSSHYSVVDMRPCFITSEDNTSTYNSQKFKSGSTVSNSTTTNGLTIPSSKVTTLQVFFFNKNALPATGSATPGVILDPNGPLVPILTN
jgi:Flp pilus assembly protein TadG